MTRRVWTIAMVVLGLVLPVSPPAEAQRHGPRPLDETGLNLGVWVYQTKWGMKVSHVFPGTPAVDIGIRRGDILLAFKAPVDPRWPGPSRWIEYPTRSLHELREAKSQIGPGVAFVVRIWRPYQGYWYPWCELQVAGGGGPAAAPAARWRPENEHSRRLFAPPRGFAVPGDVRPSATPPEPAGEFPPEPCIVAESGIG